MEYDDILTNMKHCLAWTHDKPSEFKSFRLPDGTKLTHDDKFSGTKGHLMLSSLPK